MRKIGKEITDIHIEASWIDNIFISNPYPQIESHVAKDGSKLFEELQPTLDLLESLKP